MKLAGAVRAVQSEALLEGNSFVLPSSSDLDVEVVALVVLGVDDHLGERVAGRVGSVAEKGEMTL